MKLKVFLILIFFWTIETNAQTNVLFQDLANMNFQRGLISSTSNDNFLFVCHGFSPTVSYTTEIEKYDILNNQWSIFTNSTIGKRWPSSEIIGSYLYLFNGSIPHTTSSPAYNDKLEKIDLQTGSITFLANNPYPVRSAGNCVWNNEIYFFGGRGANGYSNKLVKYNVANDQWSVLSDMPIAKETRGEVVNGKIYVIGGWNDSVSNSIDVYDIQTDSWQHLLDMPNGVSAHSTAVHDNKVWIVGDYTNQTSIGYYDIAQNVYVSCVSQNMIGRRHFGAEVVGNRLYIMGGNQTPSASSALNSLQFAELETTSVVLQNEINKVKIYPNPSSKKITISTPQKIIELKINDIQGKTIIKRYNLNDLVTLDISNLIKGIYFVTIRYDKFIITKKIIKE